jgi:hypothetical protein
LRGEPQLPIWRNSQGNFGSRKELGLMPEMEMVREHEVDVAVILPAEHGVVTVDLLGKEGHAFVQHSGTVERNEFEVQKIGRLEKLRED